MSPESNCTYPYQEFHHANAVDELKRDKRDDFRGKGTDKLITIDRVKNKIVFLFSLLIISQHIHSHCNKAKLQNYKSRFL